MYIGWNICREHILIFDVIYIDIYFKLKHNAIEKLTLWKTEKM